MGAAASSQQGSEQAWKQPLTQSSSTPMVNVPVQYSTAYGGALQPKPTSVVYVPAQPYATLPGQKSTWNGVPVQRPIAAVCRTDGPTQKWPDAKKKVMEVAPGRCAQVVAASGLGGALIVGTGGAGAGLLAGGATGAVLGLVPALFTFGLSIPFMTVIGGTCGTVVGAATGGVAGSIGGSAIGYGAYKKRTEIRTLMFKINLKMSGAFRRTKAGMRYYANLAKKKAADYYSKTIASSKASKAKLARSAQNAKVTATQIVGDKDVQKAAASAVGGGVALGAGGAVAGLTTGGVIGAAVGVVPAIFTLGLSIPLFAVVGGGCGLVAGTAVGGTTGAAAGLGGYCAYKRRDAIRSSLRSMVEKTSTSVECLAAKAGFPKVSKIVRAASNNIQQRLGGPMRSPSPRYVATQLRSPMSGSVPPRPMTHSQYIGFSSPSSPYGGVASSRSP